MTTDAALYRLLAWLSPSFPVGAYSFSHGLEFAIEDGLVHDADTLSRWLAAILDHGAGHHDAVLFCAAYDAVCADDPATLRDVAAWAAAMQPSAEIALENTAQGQAFVTTVRDTWPDAASWFGHLGAAPAYPVAVATAAAAAGIALSPALIAYLHAFIANLVSAGVRLVPLGQTAGQRLVAAFAEPVFDAAATAIAAAPEDWRDRLGTATPMADWASLKHETQYTRLFRS